MVATLPFLSPQDRIVSSLPMTACFRVSYASLRTERDSIEHNLSHQPRTRDTGLYHPVTSGKPVKRFPSHRILHA
jgi:hypothetical protein